MDNSMNHWKKDCPHCGGTGGEERSYSADPYNPPDCVKHLHKAQDVKRSL